MTHTVRRALVGVLAAVAVALLTWPAAAAQRPPAPSSGRAAAVEQDRTGSAPADLDDESAVKTRKRLEEVLERYPPTLARVLKLDPTLLGNPAYLAPYPQLAAFVAQHPEVARSPGFFFENINSPVLYTSNDPRWRARQEMMGLLAGVAAFLAFLVVTGVIVWLIKMIVTSRRWSRLSKVQFDVHSKLLDRFTSNEDLLAYVQTPAGRRFLESAPIRLQDEPRSIAAPFSRILWSVQAGIVLLIGGLGMLYVSTRFLDEPAQFFLVVGVLTLALGGGFIVSAMAAYALSRRLGLLDPPVADHA